MRAVQKRHTVFNTNKTSLQNEYHLYNHYVPLFSIGRLAAAASLTHAHELTVAGAADVTVPQEAPLNRP